MANVTITIAAGATAPYYCVGNITKRLCKSCCVNNPPMFSPTYSVVSFASLGTNQYVANCNVQGVIAYNPCGSDGCCTKMEYINESFTIPFVSTSTPTSVTLTGGTTINDIAVAGCGCTCGRTFVSETPLTLTIA